MRKVSIEIIGNSRSAERAFQRAGHAAGVWNSEMVRAGRGAFAATIGFAGLGRAVAFASGSFITVAGLATALKASTTAFIDFQDQMNKTVGLAGIAESQVGKFSDAILKLAPSVGVAPQELARAFYFISSSGIAASKAMDVLTYSAKGAVAGLGDTQTVADALTSAINAYGAANLSAAQASDILVTTVKEGKGEADQIAASIGNVAALAAQLGVSFADVGASMAAMTRLGTDAQTTAIQLQAVFSNLLKVTPQAAKGFAQVGLSADFVRKVFAEKGMLAGLAMLKERFQGNDKALAQAFPNIRALRGLLALIGKQSAEVAGIFQRTGVAAGATSRAFAAVSGDVAQKFRRMRAAAQVTGITLGAMFAPVTGAIADTLTKANTHFQHFLHQFSAATTIRAKLNVIWEGVRGAAVGATTALATAIKGVNWAEVWATAGDAVSGLQSKLESIDWSSVGGTIGTRFVTVVKKALGGVKELGARLTDVIASINWDKAAVSLGAGLALVLTQAFVTLTDPVFWAKHWDLALAVGLTIFGGSVGKVAGKIVAPFSRLFARLAPEAALVIARGFERISPRLGEPILRALMRLPGQIDRLLGRMVGPFVRFYRRLRPFGRFLFRIVGLDVAVRAVAQTFNYIWDKVRKPFKWFIEVSGLKGVVNTFRDAFHVIHGLFVWNFNEIGQGLRGLFNDAVRIALSQITLLVGGLAKAFGWIPYIGGKLKAASKGIQDWLNSWAPDYSNQTNAAAKGGQDAAIAYGEAFVQSLRAKYGINAPQDTSTIATITSNAAITAHGTGLGPPTQPPPTTTPRTTIPDVIVPKGLGGDTGSTVDKGFTLPFRLRLAQAKAEVTKSTVDDIKVAREIKAYILKVLPRLHGEKLIEAYGELKTVNDQIAQAAQDAANIGWDIPKALQLAEAKQTALGKDLTGIDKRIVAAATRALKSGKLGIDGQIAAWNTIADYNQRLKDQGDKAIRTFKHVGARAIVAGLGLTGTAATAMRQRLNAAPVYQYVVPVGGGHGGGTTINVNGPLHLHGVQDVSGFEDELHKRAKHRPKQRRK